MAYTPTGAAPDNSGALPIEQIIQAAALKNGVDPAILRKVLLRESRLNIFAPNGDNGEVGIAQMLPSTDKWLGIDPKDPTQSIFGAALFLKRNLDQFSGDYKKAVAAYNWGPGNVSKFGLDKAPQSTKDYLGYVFGSDDGKITPPTTSPLAPSPGMASNGIPGYPFQVAGLDNLLGLLGHQNQLSPLNRLNEVSQLASLLKGGFGQSAPTTSANPGNPLLTALAAAGRTGMALPNRPIDSDLV